MASLPARSPMTTQSRSGVGAEPSCTTGRGGVRSASESPVRKWGLTMTPSTVAVVGPSTAASSASRSCATRSMVVQPRSSSAWIRRSASSAK